MRPLFNVIEKNRLGFRKAHERRQQVIACRPYSEYVAVMIARLLQLPKQQSLIPSDAF